METNTQSNSYISEVTQININISRGDAILVPPPMNGTTRDPPLTTLEGAIDDEHEGRLPPIYAP